ncbi:XRE family transcriptional regulator [Listeria monocytogenes]|nr:XRE family transcriptional regulator [Listeria monocytogenes]EAD3993470.1 XRE family transcriptional regulator [Listeria monocytogenes]EAD4041146.1 XRE family transcriptional regulator [Listeria monocytogenes]EAD4041913.1 XRE family transcriptional regulator [Listeria monocytogenes]EAG5276241.1 XRE family transcriptional regulator [Listeria monocytogenes]
MEKTIGETIKFIRTSKNISQKEICLDNISRSSLVKIESNKTIPSSLTLEFILLQLGIQQEEFAHIRNNFKLNTRQVLLEKFNNINTSRGIANISEILYVKERLKYARFYATS